METDEKIFNVLMSFANQLTGYFYHERDGLTSHKGLPGVVEKLSNLLEA
jgi:hypothetical protein